jgi:hypothetical protein
VQSFHRDGNNENHSNVRITVQVPRSVRIGAHSVNGGVSVREVGAEVRANSVNGSVRVVNATGPVKAKTVNGGVDVTTTTGPVTAETVNGNVDARMGTLQGDDNMTFKTVNGSVSIYVPARFDGTFRFDTVHGGIDSDFPMTLSGRWAGYHGDQRQRQHLAEKAVNRRQTRKRGADWLPFFLGDTLWICRFWPTMTHSAITHPAGGATGS